MSGYRVAVDYGTSFTAAAMVDGSVPEVVEFSSERHSRYLSSLVLVDQRGELHVGVRAVAKRGAVPPDQVCVAPKRQLGAGPVVLGERSLSGAEVVGATLAKVAEEVLHQHNGVLPDELVMTHPAAWSTARCELLTQAAMVAGLVADPGAVRLVSEPAAAVSFYAGAGAGPEVPVGGSVAVYDLGGGTFDCAVLTRTAEGWVLAGPPGGDERLGGEDFDEALLDWVAERIRDLDPQAWETFEDDDSPRGRRDWVMLLENITTAKEELSHDETTEIGLPLGALPLDSLLITRVELTTLIGQALDRSMHAFEQTLAHAELTPQDLTAVYLTGGSSRIPAVKTELHRRYRIEPTTYKDPKTITPLGALMFDEDSSARAERDPEPVADEDPDASRFHIASAREFQQALVVAAEFSAGLDDHSCPVLLNPEDDLLAGGNGERAGHLRLRMDGGEDWAGVFSGLPILDWFGDEPAPDEPVRVAAGSDVITFSAGFGQVTVSAVQEPDLDAIYFDLPGGTPLARTEFASDVLPNIVWNVRNRPDHEVELTLKRNSIVIGGYEVRITHNGALAFAALPPGLLLASLNFMSIASGMTRIQVALWPELVLIACGYPDSGQAHMVAFFTTTVAPGDLPPGVPQGSTQGHGTVTITPHAILGGVGSVSTEFRLTVDGQEHVAVPPGGSSWQPHEINLTPGRHVIGAYCLGPSRYGNAECIVDVIAGQRVSLVYRQPKLTFLSGRLTLT